jgi:hypothetical protein
MKALYPCAKIRDARVMSLEGVGDFSAPSNLTV